MESLIMNYSDEEDVFPSEDEAESNHFTSRTPNPDIDAVQENIMEIPDRPVKMLETFVLPVVKSPCDMKDAANNTIKSFINQMEGDDNIEVVSVEGDSKDAISSVIISRVKTVVDDQDNVALCKSSAKATSPISSTSFIQHGTKTETTMDFDNRDYDNGFPISNKVDEESNKETPTAATVPFSSSSLGGLGGQEANLETLIYLHKCENHGILSPKSEREYEESDNENSTAGMLPLLFSSIIGQAANAETAIASDSNKSHNESFIKEEEDEECANETPAAVNFPFSSSSLVGQEADLETSIELDKCENYGLLSPKSERKDEESNIENSTAATLPISFSSLVEREAYTATEIALHSTKSHTVPLIKDEKDEKTDLKNPVSIITDKPSESQGESSGHVEANSCDTSANSQKYQHKHVISDRRIFKCKLCSYSSAIRFGLKRHMLSHSENSNLIKIKCEFCPFKAKSKKRLSNHLLVRHKNEQSKCTICDTFVPAHLKDQHLLRCKRKIYIFECEVCQYKALHERMFMRHQIECNNKRRSIPRQSEASGGQCGILENNQQLGKINEPSKQLYRCDHCSYSTKLKCLLKRHIRTHTVSNRPIHRCSECDYKSTRQGLTRHLKVVHKTKFEDGSLSTGAQQLKSCNFCSYTTKYGHLLKTHRQLHILKNKPIISCTKCNYKAPQVLLTCHYKKVHGLQKDNPCHQLTEMVYTCKFCSYTTKCKQPFEIHRQLHIVKNEPIVSCTKCDYKAPRVTLFYHYKKVHGSQKDNPHQFTATCKFCSFTTHNESNLGKHTRLHTVQNRPVYRCPKCDYKSTKINFSKHLKTVHKIEFKDISSLTNTKILKKCDFCSYTTTTKQHLKKHRQLHILRNRPIVSCTKCDYKAPQITVTRHYRNVHAPPKDNAGQLTETEYACKLCSFTTQDKRTLRRHTPLHTVHNRPIYRCTKCGYKSTKRNFLKHVETAHKTESKNTSLLAKTNGLKKCDFCSYTTKYDQQLKNHRQLHIVRNEPIVSCIKCDYKAPRVTLSSHYMNVHGSHMNKIEKLACTLCSYTTHEKSNLNAHTCLHTIHNSPVYRCPKCDYQSTLRNFLKHLKSIHKMESKDISSLTKIRLKKCDFCSYTTEANAHLKKHRQLHTLRNKPIISCTKCDYKAPKVTLTRHYKIVHGSQRNNSLTEYTCKFCSHTSKREDSAQKHLLLHTVHNRPIYNCPKCDYKSTKINITKHVKAVHKIQCIDTYYLKARLAKQADEQRPSM